MNLKRSNCNIKLLIFTCVACLFVSAKLTFSQEHSSISLSNFGLPGIIDLPSAKRLPDGELVVTHHNNEHSFMTGISFQALPRVGVTFRYGGQGSGGDYAQGRKNWDRSFNTHISIIDEGKYLPAISVGLRDFIGTGWYSSEYIVGTKSIGDLELSAGLGFGRLAGRNSFSNPFGILSSRFETRQENRKTGDRGGTLGNINWFHGETSPFYGINYRPTKKITLSAEYTPDLMSKELQYMDVKSPWNFGASYHFNDYANLAAQYLHGNLFSVTAQVTVNPNRPPLEGGKELAPVPMRLRDGKNLPVKDNNLNAVKQVLDADLFEIHSLNIDNETIEIVITNTKFRSTTQAVGRVSSTLQRFTSDGIKIAKITFYSNNLQTSSYFVNLEKISQEQFEPAQQKNNHTSIIAIDPKSRPIKGFKHRMSWGVGPYFAHRLFNPNLPFSMEAGIEVEGGYYLAPGLQLSGALRKSVLTNLTDNNRRSNSLLPRVHSDWPLYDLAGQSGHIHKLTLSYTKNIRPRVYGRVHAGLLEPFFAGIGGEILYKPAQWPIGIGIDVHRVRKRAYDMRFDLLDYTTTVGHLSFYYDAGGMFDVEVNAGRYLAGDWGATTTISRKFGSGWEVGGYATLTDVPFNTFGEGSFDKAIYISVPIDWIISSPTRSKRRLSLRPITRDGGANLFSARKLYRHIERTQNAQFQRELGRLWR